MIWVRPAAGIVSLALAVAPVSANMVSARVLAITDGDTIKIESICGPQVVRLKGIDAPEMKMTAFADRQAKSLGVTSLVVVRLGRMSRDRLAELIPTNSTVLVEDKGKGRDKYGRVIAYIYEPKYGNQVNFQMVADGWAVSYAIGKPDDIAPTIKEGENIARMLQLGIWANIR